MLRVTTRENGGVTIFFLEGKVIGNWVGEFEHCWLHWKKSGKSHRRSRIDLSEVRFVDDDGKTLLKRLASEGAELQANNPFMRSLINRLLENSARARDLE